MHARIFPILQQSLAYPREMQTVHSQIMFWQLTLFVNQMRSPNSFQFCFIDIGIIDERFYIHHVIIRIHNAILKTKRKGFILQFSVFSYEVIIWVFDVNKT